MADGHIGHESPVVPAYDSIPILRRGVCGVWADFSELYVVRLEAFGQTEADLQQAVARYLQAYPWESYRTRFDTARESDGEFVALGSRNALEGWF